MSNEPPIALRDVGEFHRLTGFSGADVYRASRDGQSWFVRKVAASAAVNSRLRAQAAKQRAFGQAVSQVLKTPAILNEGEVGGLYYFDMELVRGLDAVNYLRQAAYQDVIDFGQRICQYLRTAAELAALNPATDHDLFGALFHKLCDVQRQTNLLSAPNLARLFLALDRLRSFTALQPTLCHGDLTLQNLLVDETGELWAVDLLDPPYEHYWQDVSKLHQDLSGGWFLLHQGRISQCVLDYLGEQVFMVAKDLNPDYVTAHPLLLACTFARILPYATTPEHIHFVSERIDFFTAQTTV